MVTLATDWQLAIVTCYLSDHCGMSDAAQYRPASSVQTLIPESMCSSIVDDLGYGARLPDGPGSTLTSIRSSAVVLRERHGSPHRPAGTSRNRHSRLRARPAAQSVELKWSSMAVVSDRATRSPRQEEPGQFAVRHGVPSRKRFFVLQGLPVEHKLNRGFLMVAVLHCISIAT
jgi:hypothetical protein